MDLAKLRADTPGAADVVHLNNAGAALPVSAVVEAQKTWLDQEALQGGYEIRAQEADTALRKPYKALGQLLNCQPDEIAVLDSATSAWTQVFYGIPFREGDRILTTQLEYGANYIAFLQVARHSGAVIEVMPENCDGDIDLAALEDMIAARARLPALIALVHVPSNCGRVYDAVGVGQVAKRNGIPYLLDACQSVGQMPVDVQAIGCDWLTGTARKFLRGPRGMGFLYASRQSQHHFEPATLDNSGATWTSQNTFQMSDTAKRYEKYEKNFAAMAGFGIALQYALDLGADAIWQRIQLLANLTRQLLAQVPGVHQFDSGGTLSGIIALSKDGVSAASATEQLRAQRINTWVTPLTTTRIAFEAKGISEDLIRVSVHYYNTEDEIKQLVAAVARLKSSLGVRGSINSALWLLLGSHIWSRTKSF